MGQMGAAEPEVGAIELDEVGLLVKDLLAGGRDAEPVLRLHGAIAADHGDDRHLHMREAPEEVEHFAVAEAALRDVLAEAREEREEVGEAVADQLEGAVLDDAEAVAE